MEIWRVLHSVRRSFWLLLLLRCCILLPAPCHCGDVTHDVLRVARGVSTGKTRHVKTESPLYPNDVSNARQETDQIVHEVTLGVRHHSEIKHRHITDLLGNSTHSKTNNPPRFDKRKQVTVLEDAIIADEVQFVNPKSEVKSKDRVASRMTRGDDSDDENVLHIGGIFPIGGEGGWQGGQACMPAANLALEDVNRRKDLLPGFKLRLHSNDSETLMSDINLTVVYITVSGSVPFHKIDS
ncbi:uncharacterized protein LOC113373971 [Ctenocephalides felis]|uniref:uncharacterized protein LOC113373971 n=1 Tax=Ctenocephalides felis TaxID=7515 RepID=UPI000E6E525C|nr:uncharacterized protein LOC113373971 [Ctenocephalides felis]